MNPHFLSVRINLINYYESLTNKLDVAIQNISATTLDPKQLNELFEVNEEAVDAIKVVMKRNLNDLDIFLKTNSISDVTTEEHIKSRALNDFCIYIESPIDREKNPFGILIVSDWFIDQNERNLIRYACHFCVFNSVRLN
jgi:hypothetical protein